MTTYLYVYYNQILGIYYIPIQKYVIWPVEENSETIHNNQ